MALTISDYNSRTIFIPQADLTFVQTGLYILDTQTFRLALRDLEDDVLQMGMPEILERKDSYVISGTGYADALLLINYYRLEFEDGQYTVLLKNSNNNFSDVAAGVLVRNQVQVIPENSGGLIIGEGADPSDVATAVWAELLSGTAAEALLSAAAASAATAAAGILTANEIVDAIIARSAYSRRDQVNYDQNGNMTARERWFPTRVDALNETNVTDTFTVSSTVDGPITRVLQTFDKIRDV